MTSYFSAAVRLTYRPPSRRPSRFFQQSILEHHLGHDLLEPAILVAQVGDFTRHRFAGRIPHEPFLPGFEELLASPVVEIRVQALAATERRNALFASQPVENDPDLFFG